VLASGLAVVPIELSVLRHFQQFLPNVLVDIEHVYEKRQTYISDFTPGNAAQVALCLAIT